MVSASILPAYLFLCLLLGGSSQGPWSNAALQLGGVGILAWAILAKDPQPVRLAGRLLLLVLFGVALLFILQLLPLPPAVWTAIPGREFAARGFALLGVTLPWLPASLSPYSTLEAALTFLPPVALLIGMLRLKTWSVDSLFAALVAGTLLSVLLGILQVSGGERWYFYQRTNLGTPVGAFANTNHFATLLLVTVPVLAALMINQWKSPRDTQGRAFNLALASAAAAILAIGILLSRSAAVLLIGPPVVAATLLLAVRIGKKRIRQGLTAVGALILFAGGTLAVFGDDYPSWGTNASIETRAEYWTKSVAIARDHAFTGTGFGTFQQAYRSYENPAVVDRWFVNHAHNDYAEIAVEGGIPALLLLGLFLFWWSTRAWDAWLNSQRGLEVKVATVASAAILLHSVFDYPLRTAAIASVMAICVALMAGARGSTGRATGTHRKPVRHATL